jgi:DNA-directed RNA polymerase I, II, and III subunit RPABC5
MMINLSWIRKYKLNFEFILLENSDLFKMDFAHTQHVRCLSCGKVINHLQDKYDEMLQKGINPVKIHEKLGLKRYCCMATLANPIALPPGIESYTPQTQKDVDLMIQTVLVEPQRSSNVNNVLSEMKSSSILPTGRIGYIGATSASKIFSKSKIPAMETKSSEKSEGEKKKESLFKYKLKTKYSTSGTIHEPQLIEKTDFVQLAEKNISE